MLDAEIAEYRKGGGVLAERASDLADLKARILRALQSEAEEFLPLPVRPCDQLLRLRMEEGIV